MDKLVYPNKPSRTQQAFIDCEELDLCWNGGWAAGKTEALLMDVAQYLHIPGFRAILLKHTYADLVVPGGILDRAKNMWLHTPGVTYKPAELRFEWEGGGGLHFGYMSRPDDYLKYRGIQVQYVGFDEINNFTLKQYLFMFCRLGKPQYLKEDAIPLKMRSTMSRDSVGFAPKGIRGSVIYT